MVEIPSRDGLRAIAVPVRAESTAWEAVVAAFPAQVAQVERAFAAGDVLRGGLAVFPTTPVYPGDSLFIFRPIPDEPSSPIIPHVLAENERWIAIDKPAGMATMPRGSHVASTATIAVRRWLHNPNVVAAHRLDAVTRGVLLLTKEPCWRGVYQKMFSSRRVRKTYLAVAGRLPEVGIGAGVGTTAAMPGLAIQGDPRDGRGGFVELTLAKPRDSLQTFVVEGEPNSATRIKVLEERGERAFYELEPLTGKTHQLRAVMAYLGAGIEGDWLYPIVREDSSAYELQLLAARLEFTDPVDGAEVRIESRQQLNW